jgi:FG-GAP repeat
MARAYLQALDLTVPHRLDSEGFRTDMRVGTHAQVKRQPAGVLIAVVIAVAPGAAPASAAARTLTSPPYAKLTSTPGLTSEFGSSVALSADAQTAVIGGESDDGGVGAAWVFTRAGSSWVQQGPKLVPRELEPHTAFGARVGARVAISGDGNTVLVGCREGALSGWIFVRSGGTWRQLGRRLTPRDRSAEDPTPASVALSADGRTAVLSGTYTKKHGFGGDGAWVFVQTPRGWKQQGSRLTGHGGSSGGFGYAAALSAHGNTLLLGPAEGGYEGSAWIFKRSHARWEQQGPRLPRSGRRDEFGTSVALSANGRTALIGRPASDPRHRAALVYTLSHEAWVKAAVLRPPLHAPSQYFGRFVALSHDGRTALVTAPNRSGAGYVFTGARHRWTLAATLTRTGGLADDIALSGDGTTVFSAPNGNDPDSTAYVFSRSSAGWSNQTPKIMPGDESGRDDPSFGYSLATSADGTTAVVGQHGGAWVFARTGSGWALQGPRLSAQGADKRFGLSVALSADGNTAVVDDPGENGPSGTVFVFRRSNGVWTQQGPGLTPSDATPSAKARGFQDGFGFAVAISADAGTILVGDPSYGGWSGASWVFARIGASWVQQGSKLTAKDESGEGGFGYSVALSSDGTRALIGGPQDNDAGYDNGTSSTGNSGAIWLFARSAGTWSQHGPKLTASDERGEQDLGAAVALSADGTTALAGGRDNAWVFAASSVGWSQQGPRLSPGSKVVGESPFGEAVALSGDGSIALIGGIPANDCGKYMNEDCSSAGTAWVFTRAGTTWTRGGTKSGRRQFGSSVALSSDGRTALVGSPLEGSRINSVQGGYVLAFALNP